MTTYQTGDIRDLGLRGKCNDCVFIAVRDVYHTHVIQYETLFPDLFKIFFPLQDGRILLNLEGNVNWFLSTRCITDPITGAIEADQQLKGGVLTHRCQSGVTLIQA